MNSTGVKDSLLGKAKGQKKRCENVRWKTDKNGDIIIRNIRMEQSEAITYSSLVKRLFV